MNCLYTKNNKSIVLIPINQLLKIVNVPNFQRPENTEHSDVIYKALMTTPNEVNLTGQISLGCISDTMDPIFNLQRVEINIVDGSHRISALRKLVQTNPSIGEHLIDVCLYICKNDTMLYDIYMKINTNKKCDLYSTHSQTVIIQGVKNFIKKTYSKYISTADHPRVPNINLDQLGRELKNRNIIDKLNITTVDELTALITDLNIWYRSRPLINFEEWGLKDSIKLTDCMQKGEIPFYLGLYNNFEWLERIILHKRENIPYEEMIHYFSGSFKRVKINPKFRMEIWSKRNGEVITGNCYVCQSPLTYNSFECGHIIPKCFNGPDTLENLEPICSQCNRSIGTMNLYDYKALLDTQLFRDAS